MDEVKAYEVNGKLFKDKDEALEEQNRADVVDFCKSYGYSGMDRYDMAQIILDNREELLSLLSRKTKKEEEDV